MRKYLACLVCVCAFWAPLHAHVKVQTLETPSKVSFWFVEDHSVPVVSLVMSFLAGTAQDPGEKVGIASLLSTMLDEGAGDLDSKAFQDRLQNLGIFLNVHVDQDRLFLSLRTPKAHLDEALSLLKLALTKPRFDPDAFDRMRAAMVRNLENMLQMPDWKASDALNRALYGSHPYGLDVREPEVLASVTPQNLARFMKDHVARDQMVLTVCGDVTPEAVLQAVQDLTNDLPEKGFYKKIDPVVLPLEGQALSISTPHPQSVALFSHPGLPSPHPDFLKLYVMTYVLGGGFHSWLMEEVREKRGLAYSAGAGTSNLAFVSLMTATFQSDAKTVEEAVALTKAQFARLANEGISEKELEAAKNFLIGTFPLRFTSSIQIATVLHGFQVDGRTPDYLEKREGLIRALNREEINAFAKSFIKPQQIFVVVAGSHEKTQKVQL